MAFPKRRLKPGECSYCIGKGYFQLLLGGSETCDHCHGTGRHYRKR
ncbi:MULTISPECIES: YuiA family protein [Alteribacter]|nr:MULTISPECIES: YuiA family protein [Alteribacter]